MKKNILYVLMALVVGVSACSDWVEVQPEDSTAFTNYFKTTKDAEALLTNLQFGIRQVMMYSTWDYNGFIADTVKDNATRQVRQLNPAQYYGDWQPYYKTLTYADIIIDNAHRFPLPESDIKPYVLQAYFARAVIYFTLARNFGRVPIRKNTVAYEKLPQSPVNEVLEYATEYALKALELQNFEDLKDDLGNQRTLKQYASKGAAAALLAHIYAWRAELENKPEFWGEAEKYCTMIIDGKAGSYKLAATPEEVCLQVMGRNSSESIWEIYRNELESSGMAYYSEYFLNYPIRADKTPQTTDNLEIFKTTVNKMYEKEDKRRDAYFWGMDADTLYSVTNSKTKAVTTVLCEVKEGQSVYSVWNINANHSEARSKLLMSEEESVTATFNLKTDIRLRKAFITKFRYPSLTLNLTTQRYTFKMLNINRVWWRLADIHLLRAECRARQNASNAAEDLNIIRRRAYGNDSHAYTASEGDLRMAIFKEREKELIFEGHRFYDVVRNGKEYLRSDLLPPAFSKLTDQDILDGALYFALSEALFANNDLIRQNIYWNRITN